MRMYLLLYLSGDISEPLTLPPEVTVTLLAEEFVSWVSSYADYYLFNKLIKLTKNPLEWCKEF